MADVEVTELEAALAPLLGLLERGYRVCARPGRVWLDRAAGGTELAEVEWDSATHERVCQALVDGGPLVLGEREIRCLGATVIAVRAFRSDRRLADVVEEGLISPLAARFLAASIDLGRNALICGPWDSAAALLAALGAEGRRPGVLEPSPTAFPPSWISISEPDELLFAGVDRVVLVDGDPLTMAHFARFSDRVLAWTGVPRLDRALIGFEAAFEAALEQPNTPLHVLSCVDLVVTVGFGGGSGRVKEIVEIAMVDDGYRPRLLFGPGTEHAPGLLQPIEAASWFDELRLAGEGQLIDELEALTRPGERSPPSPPAAPSPTAPLASVSAIRGPGEPRHTPPSAPEVDLSGAPPPGWELDQLADAEIGAGDEATETVDDANLAATYGLAPPPRPPGVNADSFDDILKRMREGEAGQDLGE